MPQVGWCSSTVTDAENAEWMQRGYRNAPYLFLLLCEISVSHASAEVGHICDHRQGRGGVSHAPAAVNPVLLLRITPVDFPQEGAE